METATVRERVIADSPATSGTVSICLLGQDYWTAKLEASLNQFGRPHIRAFKLPLNLALARDLHRTLAADIFVRVGLRPGARTLRGGGFDALWSTLRRLNPRAARVYYWLGTDVLNTTEDLKGGRLRQQCYEQAKSDHHLTDAPWLAAELQEIGIEALPKPLTVPQTMASEIPDMPEIFSVLTYIPDARYRFYGGEFVYEAAQRLPGVPFEVLGGSGSWVPKPLDNLIFHGWQSDTTRFYQGAAVLIRMVKHDGTGLTVVEALHMGRHVIYSQPLATTNHVAFGDVESLVATLTRLWDQHRRGLLSANHAGVVYAQEQFNHHDRMQELVSYFLAIATNGRGRRPLLHGR